jgi:hypothetical protein
MFYFSPNGAYKWGRYAPEGQNLIRICQISPILRRMFSPMLDVMPEAESISSPSRYRRFLSLIPLSLYSLAS